MNVKKKATFSPPQKQPFRILFKPIIKFNKLINFSHCRVKILLIKNSQLLLDRTIFFKSKKKNHFYQLLLIFIFIFVKFFLRAEYTLFRYPFFLHPFSLRRGSIHLFHPPFLIRLGAIPSEKGWRPIKRTAASFAFFPAPLRPSVFAVIGVHL